MFFSVQRFETQALVNRYRLFRICEIRQWFQNSGLIVLVGKKKVEIRDWIFVGEGGIVSESRVEVAYLYLSIFSGEVRK